MLDIEHTVYLIFYSCVLIRYHPCQHTSQHVMDLSIIPHSTRYDALLHARKFLESICPRNLILMYLDKFSCSLVMDSRLNFAKGNSYIIEDTFRIDSSAIKSATTFNGLRSTQNGKFQQQPHLSPRNR